MTEFVKTEEKQGKKYTQVAKMIDHLRGTKEPVPFKVLCDKAGVKYEQDVQAAMFALELVSFIDRYSYVEDGSTRKHAAYALNAKAGRVRPTRGASSASTKSSKKAVGTKSRKATDSKAKAA